MPSLQVAGIKQHLVRLNFSFSEETLKPGQPLVEKIHQVYSGTNGIPGGFVDESPSAKLA